MRAESSAPGATAEAAAVAGGSSANASASASSNSSASPSASVSAPASARASTGRGANAGKRSISASKTSKGRRAGGLFDVGTLKQLQKRLRKAIKADQHDEQLKVGFIKFHNFNIQPTYVPAPRKIYLNVFVRSYVVARTKPLTYARECSTHSYQRWNIGAEAAAFGRAGHGEDLEKGRGPRTRGTVEQCLLAVLLTVRILGRTSNVTTHSSELRPLLAGGC